MVKQVIGETLGDCQSSVYTLSNFALALRAMRPDG